MTAHATTPLVTELSRAIERRLDVLAKSLPLARRGDVRGVHRARVASRRLREALAVVNASERKAAQAARRDLRRVTEALGAVRELDVARHLLREDGRLYNWPRAAVACVDRRCADTRRERRAALVATLQRSDVARIVDDIHAIRDALGSRLRRSRTLGLLASRLRKRARALARSLDAAGTLYAPAPLHAVRLAAKKLRYTLELAHEAAGLQARREIRQLQNLQTLLGRLHDLQVLQLHAQKAAAERGLGRTAQRGLQTLNLELERHCRELHAKFVAAAPRFAQLAARASGEWPLRLVKQAPTPMAKAPMSRAPASRRPAFKQLV